MTAVAVSLIQSGMVGWISNMGQDAAAEAYDKQVIAALNDIIVKATDARSALAAKRLLRK